jgi:hypothetical protein
MNFLTTAISRRLLGLALLTCPFTAWPQNPGAGAAISSEAVANQPKIPEQLPVPVPDKTTLKPTAAPTAPGSGPIDPLLDPARPRNCQITLSSEQTIACGEIKVVMPPGTYKQILIVENPEGRRAADHTDLKRQQVGLGYIRYLSEEKLSVNGQPRFGGLDVPIRAEDNLPVRIWYKKMTEVDDITKAFTFILPPVGLITGAGAWSSGNTLLPDAPPQFTEARDYFFKDNATPEPAAQPAFQLRPDQPQPPPGKRQNR